MRRTLIAILILCNPHVVCAQTLNPWTHNPDPGQRFILSDTYIANLIAGCETTVDGDTEREKCKQLVVAVNELMQSVRQQLVYIAQHEHEPNHDMRALKLQNTSKELRSTQSELFKQFPTLARFATVRPVSPI